MGPARLLAKGWIAVCLFAGADALYLAVKAGADPLALSLSIGICFLLFVAMGFVFVVGFSLSSASAEKPWPKKIDWSQALPGFNEAVFLIFMALSFVNLAFFAPTHMIGALPELLERAISFAVPGQRALEQAVLPCMIDGGRVFASSFSWLLALIYLCSCASRIRSAAERVKAERRQRPEALGEKTHAVFVGIVALVGVQLLYVGSLYTLLPCSLYAGIAGTLVIGLAPLMLAYAVLAAMTALLAMGKE